MATLGRTVVPALRRSVMAALGRPAAAGRRCRRCGRCRRGARCRRTRRSAARRRSRAAAGAGRAAAGRRGDDDAAAAAAAATEEATAKEAAAAEAAGAADHDRNGAAAARDDRDFTLIGWGQRHWRALVGYRHDGRLRTDLGCLDPLDQLGAHQALVRLVLRDRGRALHRPFLDHALGRDLFGLRRFRHVDRAATDDCATASNCT